MYIVAPYLYYFVGGGDIILGVVLMEKADKCDEYVVTNEKAKGLTDDAVVNLPLKKVEALMHRGCTIYIDKVYHKQYGIVHRCINSIRWNDNLKSLTAYGRINVTTSNHIDRQTMWITSYRNWLRAEYFNSNKVDVGTLDCQADMNKVIQAIALHDIVIRECINNKLTITYTIRKK